MNYSEPHRTKLRMWQTCIVLVQLLDPKIYTPEFRSSRPRDIIPMVNEIIWKVIKLNNVPSLRQYIEIFTVRFILAFPEVAIEPYLLNTLLDINTKPQVGQSFLLISGLIMNELQDVSLKKRIYDNFIGFCNSSSAHMRVLAQYYVI